MEIDMSITIGIDIGTTNIEYAFSYSLSNDVSLYIERNPLSRYGLDVMTRITKANNGLLAEMSQCLRRSICDKINEILRIEGAKPQPKAQVSFPMPDMPNYSSLDFKLEKINIAANTTMIHILMNYDCTNLGSFPFSPVHTEAINTSAKLLRISAYDIPVSITPGLSAFVGGDIVSGLSVIQKQDNYLLIDLGTNAEMVLVKGNDAYITSAAAGPAFETCSYGHATDAIDGMVYMLDSAVMDETGLLCDEYFDSGYDCNGMHFPQKKIRDFQMAKSAIRTGIELLIKSVNKSQPQRFSISTDENNSLDHSCSCALTSNTDFTIYIAGTFGQHLNIANAIRIGMFPDWFNGRCKALGNTSLAGTLSDSSEYSIFTKNIKEIVLANIPEFNEYYINYMNF